MFLQDYTVEDFDMDDFTYYHQELLAERNGQWLDENGNTSLWLSQGCYISMKCIVTGLWIFSLFAILTSLIDGVQQMTNVDKFEEFRSIPRPRRALS